MNVLARFVAGIAIGVAVTGGCYAFAATAASRIGASYATDAQRQSRMSGAADSGALREGSWKAIKDWSPDGAKRASRLQSQ